MLVNYVLIDFENVQPEALQALAHECFQVLVFVGANQKKIPIGLASALQGLGPRGQYVQIAGNGSNALDFHIAYYIGHLATLNPKAYFHVVSKDAGFDPLIDYLKREKKILVARRASLEEISFAKNLQLSSPSERADAVFERLGRQKTGKPGTVKALRNVIGATLGKQLLEEEVEAVIKAMVSKKLVAVKETKVSYPEKKAMAGR